MNNTSSIIRITAVFLCIILLFSYGVYSFLFKPEKAHSNVNYLNAFSPFLFENQTDKSRETPVINTENGSEAISASANREVLGNIINQTIRTPGTTSSSDAHIKNSTDLSVNINALLSQSLQFSVEKNSAVQVLIIHTHATESFLSEDRDYYTAADNSRTTDNSLNVTELGAIIAQKLNEASIVTIHDRTQHDYPSYNGSYSRAATTIKEYLKKYPSIKIVIDVHRDAIQSGTTKTKLTAKIGDRSAAQVMLVMGSQSGNVNNFENWQENLKLALKLQKNMESMYPSLARPLSLVSRNYNESLTTGSMLLEIGTDANTFSEAKYSAELVAQALIKTLGG